MRTSVRDKTGRLQVLTCATTYIRVLSETLKMRVSEETSPYVSVHAETFFPMLLSDHQNARLLFSLNRPGKATYRKTPILEQLALGDLPHQRHCLFERSDFKDDSVV